jgi:hypothetical protein
MPTLYISAMIEDQAGDEVLRLVDRRQRARRAPVDVAQHDRRPHRQEHLPPRAGGAGDLDDRQHDDDDAAGDQVGLDVDRLRDEEQGGSRRHCPQDRKA